MLILKILAALALVIAILKALEIVAVAIAEICEARGRR